MLSLRSILAALLLSGIFLGSIVRGESAAPSRRTFEEALGKEMIGAEITGNGRHQLRASLTNPSSEPIHITVPAGMIFRGTKGGRVVILRSAGIDLPALGAVDAEIPAAALSSHDPVAAQTFTATGDSEQRLSEFLNFLATHDDAPRTTSQLVVLALLEDLSYAKWQQFLAGTPDSNSERKGAEVVQAIDALGLLREVAPGKDFTLARDNELKLRALRNPFSRPKAVQIYGLTPVEEPANSGGGIPNLKQLLHTQPGDNCPTCRMRENAKRGAGDF